MDIIDQIETGYNYQEKIEVDYNAEWGYLYIDANFIAKIKFDGDKPVGLDDYFIEIENSVIMVYPGESVYAPLQDDELRTTINDAILDATDSLPVQSTVIAYVANHIYRILVDKAENGTIIAGSL